MGEQTLLSGEDGAHTRRKNLLQATLAPTPSSKRARTKEAMGLRLARSIHQWFNARRPRPISRPPKPLPDQGEEEETNIPDQREHLPVSLQTPRNFYMKSSPANNGTKPRRSASARSITSMKTCCGSTVKRSGATVGNVTPGYP